MMEQQQHQQTLPFTDLTANGAIDLMTLPPVTSPTSISSVDDDRDDISYNHDDTGYNTAVSSISSDCTSPSPLGLGGGVSGDLDTVLSPPDFRFTSDLNTDSFANTLYADASEFSPDGSGASLYVETSKASLSAGLGSFHAQADSPRAGLFCVPPLLVTGQEYSAQDSPVSVSSSIHSFTDSGMVSNAGMVSVGCSSDLTTNLSSEESDPFLCSGGSSSGCGEVAANVMEDMELLEDLLVRITDCEKPESSPNVRIELTHDDGEEEETLFENTLSVSTVQPKDLGEEARCVAPQHFLESSQRPPSLLRTLLDQEGQAIEERPSLPKQTAPCTGNATPNHEKVDGCGKIAMLNKDKGGQSLDQTRPKTIQKQSRLKQSQSDRVGLTRERADESEDEVNVLPTALPDDLLDLAMEYYDALTDMDHFASEGMEADAWHSTMDDLMASDSQMPGSPVSRNISLLASKAGSNQVAKKAEPGEGPQSLAQSPPLNGTKSLNKTIISVSATNIQPAAVSSTYKLCATGISSGTKQVKSIVVQPVAKEQGNASMLKPQIPQSLVTSPASCSVVSPASTKVPLPASCNRVLSPVLTDHRYSSAHALSLHSKVEPPAGKRLCVESDKPHPPRGKTVLHVQLPNPQSKSHSHSSVKTSQKLGNVTASQKPGTFSGKVIITCPSRNQSITTNKTTVIVGRKMISPAPVSPTPVPVPANGGGKPLTAMSELEKHLRGLAAPMECQKELDDTLTPVGECGDTSSRPFLERLLTGEISHERYRQIDYQLLYQERERRLSETSSGQSG